MQKINRWLILLAGIMIVPLLTSPALARVPAAVVVEIADAETNPSLYQCKGVSLQDSTVFISKKLGDQVRGTASPEQNIHIETGLTQSEEINSIVLLRSRDACDIFLAAKRLPPAQTVFSQLNSHDETWSLDQADAVLHLNAGTKSFSLAPEKGLVTGKEYNGMRLHNYGRLALWEAAAKKQVEQIGVHGRYVGHFDGPGAEAAFHINIPEAGTLAIAVPTHLQPVINIMFSRPGRVFSWRTGSRKDFDRPSEGLVLLKYTGFGPADYRLDLSFAARRHGPARLACTLEVGNIVEGKYPLRLRLSNTGRRSAEIFKLTQQTLSFYLQGELKGDRGIWERPPEKMVLGAGQSITQAFGWLEKAQFEGSYATVRIPNNRAGGRERFITCPVGSVGQSSPSWGDVLGDPRLEPETVYAMIKSGTDVNKPEAFGRKQLMTYPLAMAVGKSGRSLQIADMLIKAGANIDQGDAHGKTVLHLAARFGYPRFAAMLIKKGASSDATDKDGQTPLFDAAYSGSGDIVALLLKSGANANATDHEGRTAMHMLQYTSFTPDPLPVAKIMLALGADVNAISEKYGAPLHQAVKQEHSALATFLISKNADVNAQDGAGNRAMHIAAGYNRVEMLALLKKSGADIDAFNKAHETPLHKAAEHVNLEASQWLLDQGADIEARSASGMTPLLLASITASASKKPAIVQLLLDRGAKVDVQDNQGNTPLSFAKKLNPDVYKILKEAN